MVFEKEEFGEQTRENVNRLQWDVKKCFFPALEANFELKTAAAIQADNNEEVTSSLTSISDGVLQNTIDTVDTLKESADAQVVGAMMPLNS